MAADLNNLARTLFGERFYRAVSSGYKTWKALSAEELSKELKNESSRQRMEKFRNLHEGEGCFIIGNGPSLGKMDLARLRDRHTFGLNKIYLLFDEIDLNLSYYVSVNRYVIDQSISEIESLTCPAFLSARAAADKVRPLDHIYFIKTNSPAVFTFSEDLEGSIYEGYTVTYVAMQLAYFMGFANVYLIGVDHNFAVRGEPGEVQTMSGTDVDHFHPGYFTGNKWQLPDLAGSEASYNLAKYFFERRGSRIYDATVGGKLNIFPRVSFEEALSACKPKQ